METSKGHGGPGVTRKESFHPAEFPVTPGPDRRYEATIPHLKVVIKLRTLVREDILLISKSSNKYFVITEYDCEPNTFAEEMVIQNHDKSVSGWRKQI